MDDTDSKPCPFCGEVIKNAAIKCRFCNSDIASTAAPPRGTTPGNSNKSGRPGLKLMISVLMLAGLVWGLSWGNYALKRAGIDVFGALKGDAPAGGQPGPKATPTGPPKDEVLLNEQTTIPAGTRTAWSVTLRSARLVKFKLQVRSGEPIDYYWMAPEEVEAFDEARTSMAGATFYYLGNFYGKAVRQVSDSRSLAAGNWSLVLFNPGQQQAHLDVSLLTNEPTGTAYEIPRPRSGGVAAGAGRYRLTITSYEVSKLKTNGSAWDLDNSPADPRFYLVYGEGTGVSNIKRFTPEEAHTNRRVSRKETDSWEFDWNGYGPVVLVAQDEDALGSNDLIGAANVSRGQAPASQSVSLNGPFTDANGIERAAAGSVRLTLAWDKVR